MQLRATGLRHKTGLHARRGFSFVIPAQFPPAREWRGLYLDRYKQPVLRRGSWV